MRCPGAVSRRGQGDGLAARGIGDAVHVVEALERGGLGEVQLDDHPVRQVDPGLRAAQRRRRDELSLLRDRRGLDEGEVDLSVEAAARVLRELAEVDVGIGDLFGRSAVDGGAQGLARHVGGAARDNAAFRPGAVELLARRGAGEQRETEFSFSAAHLSGQRLRYAVIIDFVDFAVSDVDNDLCNCFFRLVHLCVQSSARSLDQFHFIHMVFDTPDLLIILVPFTCQHDHVTSLGML